MYAVCVTFQIEQGAMAAFLPLMHDNAKTSLATETGCLQFDVLTDGAHPQEVFLYERYADRAAFDTHLQSAHFKPFAAATQHLIAAKDVRTWSEVAQ